MRAIDIRPLKKRMREEIKIWRKTITLDQKRKMDAAILERIISLREYAACHTIFTYVSLPNEVDTLKLISYALSDGKRVAVPMCIENSREMHFYYIRSMADLRPKTFGILEPVPEICERVSHSYGSICIVPALAYDEAGFRLGYGSGYYDRFLSTYRQPKIGLVYSYNVKKELWHGRYDIPVNLIITEKKLIARLAAAFPRRRKHGPTR